MESNKGAKKYAEYKNFSLSSETSRYKLNLDKENYAGTLVDSMFNTKTVNRECVGKKFSTIDQDNDWQLTDSCAKQFLGGWWYGWCTDVNLNAPVTNTDSLMWSNWRKTTIVKSEMKMKWE